MPFTIFYLWDFCTNSSTSSSGQVVDVINSPHQVAKYIVSIILEVTLETFFRYRYILWYNFLEKFSSEVFGTNFGYALVRPFLYFDHFHIFDLFCTSTRLLRPLYFDLLSNMGYWSRSTGRNTVLVEVKFGQKGRSKVVTKKSK